MRQRLTWLFVVFALLFATALFIYQRGQSSGPGISTSTLKVLAYSSFINSWGPGPAIAEEFKKQTGIQIQYQDGGDAGLLIAKLKLFTADVVLGLDQFGLAEASGDGFSPAAVSWQKVVPFDWAPLTFIFRKGEIEPPTSLDDLLSSRFQNKISLEDPRTSSAGLQFLFWVLDVKGIDGGFAFLKNLKPNVRAVSPSWSGAYGLFQKKQAALAFSYLTSPVYHWMNEKPPESLKYAPAVFSEGQPVQTEYAAIPQACQACEAAEQFLKFLNTPVIQKKIMQNNFMFPVLAGVTEQTEFAKLPAFKKRDLKNYPELLKKKKELLEKWQALEL